MKLKHIAAAGILSLAMASAFAGDWYVVGSIGQSTDKTDSKGDIDDALVSAGVTGLSSSFDDKDTGYKLQLGYQLTPNFAIEGGYVDLGKFKYSASFTGPSAGTGSAEAKASGLNIAAVGIAPINDQFSVFGKFGFINAKVEISATATGSGTSASGSESATKMKANFGIGAAYNFDKAWGLRAEWERFNNLGDKNKTGESDVDMLSVGVVFNF